MEAVLLLPMISRKVEMKLTSDRPVALVPSFALIPRDGIKVRLFPRLEANAMRS
jgi:hypothetical protein